LSVLSLSTLVIGAHVGSRRLNPDPVVDPLHPTDALGQFLRLVSTLMASASTYLSPTRRVLMRVVIAPSSAICTAERLSCPI
jgi:hypothetical protein